MLPKPFLDNGLSNGGSAGLGEGSEVERLGMGPETEDRQPVPRDSFPVTRPAGNAGRLLGEATARLALSGICDGARIPGYRSGARVYTSPAGRRPRPDACGRCRPESHIPETRAESADGRLGLILIPPAVVCYNGQRRLRTKMAVASRGELK